MSNAHEKLIWIYNISTSGHCIEVHSRHFVTSFKVTSHGAKISLCMYSKFFNLISQHHTRLTRIIPSWRPSISIAATIRTIFKFDERIARKFKHRHRLTLAVIVVILRCWHSNYTSRIAQRKRIQASLARSYKQFTYELYCMHIVEWMYDGEGE